MNSLLVSLSIVTLIVTFVSDIDLTPDGLTIVSWYVLSLVKPETSISTLISLIESSTFSSPKSVIFLTLGVIVLIALPLATSPTGVTLIGTTLLGEVIFTVAVNVPGTISILLISVPFSSYATNLTFSSL